MSSHYVWSVRIAAPVPAIRVCCTSADFLVQHLQTLVDLGFKLTTGSAESLRPSGAQLLQQLLRFFGTVPDPDVPELLLLEQYQVGAVTILAVMQRAYKMMREAGACLASALGLMPLSCVCSLKHVDWHAGHGTYPWVRLQ
jgi:hypothetical protein